MSRYFTPLIMVAASSSLLALMILFLIPPANPLIIAAFLVAAGLALASAGALGIYFLRRFYGPKDSPRYLLRRSLRQAIFLAVGVVALLFLQILGAVNPVSLLATVTLLLTIERLT